MSTGMREAMTMTLEGALWGKTNLKEQSRKDGQRVLLESTTHVPSWFHWHSLLHHMIDVGACAWALLMHSVIKRRFKHLTGCDLTPTIRVRLVVLIMLHDLGKVQVGFQ